MVQIIFGLIYTTYDSISLTLTVALKLLEENPAVLKEMTVSIMLLYFNLYVCIVIIYICMYINGWGF